MKRRTDEEGRTAAQSAMASIQMILDDAGCVIVPSLDVEHIGELKDRALVTAGWGVVPRTNWPVDPRQAPETDEPEGDARHGR